MLDTLQLPAGWKQVAHPPSLFCRYEFPTYSETREFLDALMLLSEETMLFPDLGFGKTHVNVTVHAQGGKVPGDAEIKFAERVAGLAAAGMP